jgi:PAS domain S-box-containing protein
MWETISSGNIWRCIFHNKRKNGELFWESASISPIKDHLGVITGYLAVKDDITLERQHESDLINREKRFHTLWENSMDAMRLTDENGIIIMVNDAYCKIFSSGKSEIIGQSITSYLDEEVHVGALERYMQRFKNKTIPLYQESLLNLKNGEKIWVNILSRFMDHEEENQVLLSIFRDITQQKRKEAELNEARDKAESMNNLKSTFLANMSHELRTPLINIMGYAEILLDEIEDESSKEMLTSILNGGERLRDTLNSILDLSNLESNKADMLFTINDLNLLVKKVFVEFEESAQKKGLEFSLSLIETPSLALVDGSMLLLVIKNLINNAIKYTDSGYVKVISGITGKGKQKLSFIKVIDSGIGIPQRKIDHIFEPFRQVSEGAGRRYEGAGLGLTIAKKFVELMAGEISVESKEGIGSVFSLEFVSEVEDLSEEESTILNKKHILIVEDDKISANLMKMYLMKNYEVSIVQTGEEALLFLGEERVELIIMDINLPGGMNGIEITSQIRHSEIYAKTPIIAITAFTLPGDQQRFIESGFDAFVVKPFRREEFIDQVFNLIG